MKFSQFLKEETHFTADQINDLENVFAKRLGIENTATIELDNPVSRTHGKEGYMVAFNWETNSAHGKGIIEFDCAIRGNNKIEDVKIFDARGFRGVKLDQDAFEPLEESVGFKYITYGLDAADLKRRETQKDFKPVGMKTIIDVNHPRITRDALSKAKAGKYIAAATYRMSDEKEVDFKELVNESLVMEADVFPDVDVIKLDPDRADSHDVVNALMPTLIRMAYVYLVDDKVKYERTHKDDEDTPFEFTEDELDERLENLIENVVKRLEEVSMRDRKADIKKMSGEFKEKLTESQLCEAKYWAGSMETDMCEVTDSRGEKYGHFSVVFKKNGKVEIVANPGNPNEAEKKQIIAVARKAMQEN